MSWDAMITSGGALVGLFVGGAIGRQGQSRQWLRDARTAAYREYLKQCSMLEIELREAYLARRDNAADWDAVLAAQTALSLVADPRSSQAAMALTDVLNQLASLVDQPRPTSDSEFLDLLSAVARAQLEFVNAARRSLYRSQRPLGALLGGPPAPDEIAPYLPKRTAPQSSKRTGSRTGS